MQDILINRKQGNGKTDEDKTAEALAALYRRGTAKENSDTKQKDAVYYRKLARPRSEKYIRLITQQIQVSKRLNQLYRLLQETSDSERDDTSGKTCSDSIRNPENGTGDLQPVSGTEQRSTAEQRSETERTDAVERINETEQAEKEIAKLKEELARIQAEAEIEMPMGHERLGFIYGSDKESRLLNMGVISQLGTTYHSDEELLELVRCVSEQEKKQWLKADSIFADVWMRCLIVEVFPTAICVVYEDGSVSCYRDE